MRIGISLVETCLLTKRWTVHRWHELNIGIYMKHGNLRTNVKGEYQVEEPQDKEYQCSHRGRLNRSSDEVSVMGMERRVQDY